MMSRSPPPVPRLLCLPKLEELSHPLASLREVSALESFRCIDMTADIAYGPSAGIRQGRQGKTRRGKIPRGTTALSAAHLILIAALVLSTLAFGAVQAWAWGAAAVLVA